MSRIRYFIFIIFYTIVLFGCKTNDRITLPDGIFCKVNYLYNGQDKQEIIRIIGQPDWEASGRNVIQYYDKKNKRTLTINFDTGNKLIRYEVVGSEKFPESSVTLLGSGQ